MDKIIVNARTQYAHLGRTVENIPCVSFTFTYFDKEIKTINTSPILLLNPDVENLQHSGIAAALITIFDIFEVNFWNEITNQVVKIEIQDDKILRIFNAINDEKNIIIELPNEEVVEAEDEEKNNVKG